MAAASAELVLIAKAQANDRQAMALLVHRYRPVVRKIAYEMFWWSRNDREDAVQMAWVAFLEAVRLYEPSKGSFASWVRRVIRCRLIDALRQPSLRQRTLSLDDPLSSYPGEDEQLRIGDLLCDPRPGPEEQALARIAWQERWRALEKILGRQERRVLLAMMWCRRPEPHGRRDHGVFYEVCELTGLTRKQVDNAWLRVQRKVRRLQAVTGGKG